jgi:hypothetical protein
MKTCNKTFYLKYIFNIQKIGGFIMQNIKADYIPVRQAIKIEDKTMSVKEFIKKNKVGLIISGIFGSLISVYAVLIINFINLIKIIY